MMDVCEEHEGIFIYKYHNNCPICEEMKELKEELEGLKEDIAELKEELEWYREIK